MTSSLRPGAESRTELLRHFAPIAERLAVILSYAHPRNRRLLRQIVGLWLFGPKYLAFIAAHFGILPGREIVARRSFGYRSYQITATGDLVERPEDDLVATTKGDNFVFRK